ncbi:hypothetical protein CTAYLR_009220 [Chrysophaeum taylorii]|uniref:Uncharacterized protein n=1 Tax=Chrysophaeum taylorii TaxID=2483200 RepID=A0AAD7UBB9_9STRA|nr:hypothetical protein CTAYLR_009220 [Chrysophaeum taylorii]
MAPHLVALFGCVGAAVAFQLPAPSVRPVRTVRRVAEVHEAATGLLAADTSSLLVSFGDQGSNLAGQLFQFSLLPYVIFLYFLNYPKTGAPPLVRFGFGYLLLFVLATIPTGVVAKSTWGVSLADCDWMHGGAESLLTVTNVLIVLGFRAGLRGDLEDDDKTIPKAVSAAYAVAVVAFIAAGIGMFEAHTPFLNGLGDIPVASEPINALSIPTWAVHWSSVAEFVIALQLAVDYARATANEKWKGLAVGMLPAHASGICACTYHLFYNQPDMAWLVAAQAGLTFAGNCALMVAAFRLARAGGWSPQTALEFRADPSPVVATPLPSKESDALFFAEVAAFALIAAYATKYGSLLAPDFLQTPHAIVAAALVIGSPLAVVATTLRERDDDDASLPAP